MKPRRVQIKSPSGTELSGDQAPDNRRNYFLIVSIFLILVSIFVAGLVLFLMGPTAPAAYNCEIGRFSGIAEVYSDQKGEWTTITRRTHHQITLHPRDKIKTGPEADVDLKVASTFDLRLKPSSEIEVLSAKRGSHSKALRLRLHQGSILGMSNEALKDQPLEIDAPLLIAAIQQASFLVQANHKDQSSVGVLEGAVEVRSRSLKETVKVQALEMLTIVQGAKEPPKPKRVNYQEWKALGEAHDLTAVSIEAIAKQLDLRKKAGSFFNYVFDEGVFYTPNWGYASREFYGAGGAAKVLRQEGEPPALFNGESGPVVLRLDYDVFPQDSFSGMYFKVRDLDLSKVHHLSFNLRGGPQKTPPEQFRIEFKDRLSTVRGFAVKPVTHDWRFYTFEFNAQKPTPVSEMVFVFEHSKVGTSSTSGQVYIKDLNIEQ